MKKTKLNELKGQKLKKKLEQRGLLTTENKAELQIRLREAMEVAGVDVDEYVFLLKSEESSTKMEHRDLCKLNRKCHHRCHKCQPSCR